MPGGSPCSVYNKNSYTSWEISILPKLVTHALHTYIILYYVFVPYAFGDTVAGVK